MRRLTIALTVALLGCSAVPPPPTETEYAKSLLARPVPASAPATDSPMPVSPMPESPVPEPAVGKSGPAGVPEVPSELQRIARDDAALDAFLEAPFGANDLAALVRLRSEEVATARASLEAARTGYRQAADLDDLAALYRSWSRDLDTQVGPVRHRRPTAAIAPTPNVSMLSGEIVERSVDLARENLRAVEFAVDAEARRTHAAVALWAESRQIVAEDLRLMEGLLSVMKARLEAGRADQAGYLAFSAAVARRKTDLAILDDRAPELAARLNHLLARVDGAPVSMALVQDDAEYPPVDPRSLVERALSGSPATRAAALRSERATIAVRLAETMTLPRFDVGSARFERERAGEAGVDRGPVFPDPGKMIMPRSDFGVREAQVTEMRARAQALAAAEKDTRLRTAAEVRSGLFALTSAKKRAATFADEVVPLAERALRATRGAYEANRVGYLDLLEAARRLVKARLETAGAKRDLSVARASLRALAGFDPWKENNR